MKYILSKIILFFDAISFEFEIARLYRKVYRMLREYKKRVNRIVKAYNGRLSVFSKYKVKGENLREILLKNPTTTIEDMEKISSIIDMLDSAVKCGYEEVTKELGNLNKMANKVIDYWNNFIERRNTDPTFLRILGPSKYEKIKRLNPIKSKFDTSTVVDTSNMWK